MKRLTHSALVAPRTLAKALTSCTAAKWAHAIVLRNTLKKGINKTLLTMGQHTGPYRIVRGEFTCCTAAPEGGAWDPLWDRVRGCALILGLGIFPISAAAQDVPSGQAVTLDEVLVDAVGAEAWLRFRFLAPQIARDGGDVSFDAARDDLLHLCDTVALPYLSAYELSGDVIVISLMDRTVPFGTSDPEATQFFEAFRMRDGACLWDSY